MLVEYWVSAIRARKERTCADDHADLRRKGKKRNHPFPVPLPERCNRRILPVPAVGELGQLSFGSLHDGRSVNRLKIPRHKLAIFPADIIQTGPYSKGQIWIIWSVRP